MKDIEEFNECVDNWTDISSQSNEGSDSPDSTAIDCTDLEFLNGVALFIPGPVDGGGDLAALPERDPALALALTSSAYSFLRNLNLFASSFSASLL
jgi:hypothetical protein